MVGIDKRETNTKMVCRNILELDGSVKLCTELNVGKITASYLRHIELGIFAEFDLGCCIRLRRKLCPPYSSYTCVDYRMIDEDDIEISTSYEGIENLEDMANSLNEQIPTRIFDRLNWEYVDCGDYWSINPSSYYCF